MRTTPSDRTLIERIAERDRSAAAELFDRYADEIHNFIARRTSLAEAQDLLHDVFARALRGASRFQGRSSVRSWIYSIARYTVYERYRGRQEEVTFASLQDMAPGPETMAFSAEQRRRLLAGIRQLPEKQAVVLELHRIDGLSHEQIGKLLGIRKSTSRKRLERAMQSLKRVLEEGIATDSVESRATWTGQLSETASKSAA